MMTKRLAAEFLGTLWLVLGGCGSAMYAAASPEVGIGLLGVSFAFGLTVLTMAYAVGGISGGHFNPAVTLGLVAAGRHSAGDALPYIVAQVLGAIAAVVILHIVASGTAGFDPATATYAANGYGEASPGAYDLGAAFVMEAVMTFFFLIIIIGSTHPKVPVAGGIRADRHRPGAHPDPPDLDPGDQHLGQPGAFDRTGALRRRRLPQPALAVLGLADRRRGPGRPGRPLAAAGIGVVIRTRRLCAEAQASSCGGFMVGGMGRCAKALPTR